MDDTIDPETYREEVAMLAERIVRDARDSIRDGGYDAGEIQPAISDFVTEDLEFHEWFVNDHSAAVYGAIVDHAEADPTQYSDWQALIAADEPATVVKRLAYVCMEADVLEAALDIADDEDDAVAGDAA